MRIAILGGGVAGTVLARQLSRTPSFRIDLLERNTALGGLHRSVQINDTWYDIGTFLFDRNHALLQTFPALYSQFVATEHRGRSLTQHGTTDLYPMSLRGYLRDNGTAALLLDIVDLLRCKLTYRKRASLVEYMRYYLGDRMYRQSGLKNYIERLYAMPDDRVDLEFALQRIPSLPDECSIRRNLKRLFRETFHAQTRAGTWQCYVRPRDGFPAAYQTVASELRRDGVNVRTGMMITDVRKHGSGFTVHCADGSAEQYDVVVSTIPVGTMMRLARKPLGCPPETVKLISLCYRFRGESGTDAGMLCNFTQKGDWKRLNIFSSYYGKSEGEDYFVVECTARNNDPRDPDYMRHNFEEHIRQYPLFKGELTFEGSVVTENAYPVLRRHDLAWAREAHRELAEFGIVVAGRQGSFVYTNADQTARNATVVANRLAQQFG